MRPSSRSIGSAARRTLAHVRRVLHRAASDDEGSASLEFLTVGLLMLVPLVYVVVALGQIQHQSMGAEAAARHMARAISVSTDAASARSGASAVLDSVADQYGMDAEAVTYSLTCIPASALCPAAGATVMVQVETRVSLPLAPPVLGLDEIASVAVEASAVQRMSRFWTGE